MPITLKFLFIALLRLVVTPLLMKIHGASQPYSADINTWLYALYPMDNASCLSNALTS